METIKRAEREMYICNDCNSMVKMIMCITEEEKAKTTIEIAWLRQKAQPRDAEKATSTAID